MASQTFKATGEDAVNFLINTRNDEQQFMSFSSFAINCDDINFLLSSLTYQIKQELVVPDKR